MNTREKLIRIAHANPELRAKLLPLIKEARQDRELVRRADALYRKLLDHLKRSHKVYEDQIGRRVVFGKHLDKDHEDIVFLFDTKSTRTFHTEQKGGGSAIVIGVKGLNPFWKGDAMGAGFDNFVKKQRSSIRLPAE